MRTVSVVVPVYNRYRFLPFLVERFLNQSLPEEERELILVNDGGTEPIPPEFEKYFVHKVNGGPPSAENHGIRASRGDFICLLGDDDALAAPNSLEIRRDFIIGNDLDLVYTDAFEIDDNNREAKLHRTGEISREAIWGRDLINLHSMMWRRSAHDVVGWFEEDLKWDDDWSWKIRCLHELRCGYLPAVTALTRYGSSNRSVGANRANLEADHRTMLERNAKKYGRQHA